MTNTEHQPPPTDAVLAKFVRAAAQIGQVDKVANADVENKAGDKLYSYSYATLTDVLNEVRRVTIPLDLAVVLVPDYVDTSNGPRFAMWCDILDAESGQTLRMGPAVSAFPSEPQVLGTAMSYLRRYLLVSVFGIPLADDDGKAAGQAIAEDQVTYETNDQAAVALLDRITKELTAEQRQQLRTIDNPNGYKFNRPNLRDVDEWRESVAAKIDEVVAGPESEPAGAAHVTPDDYSDLDDGHGGPY